MKTVSALILLVAASLSMAAQTYPSKEYVRLGSRVMAIEAPPTLLPSGESAAANNGETGTPIQITGSPNSSWSASTGAGAITLGATMGTTDSAGVATITYNLAGNAQQTAFTVSVRPTQGA
jgi:hypothetical protein